MSMEILQAIKGISKKLDNLCQRVTEMEQLEKRAVSLEYQISMLKQQFWEINKLLNEHINNIGGHKY